MPDLRDLEQALNSAKEAFLLLDLDISVRWANHAARQFFGRDDLAGAWMGDLFPSISCEILEAAALMGGEFRRAAVSVDGRCAGLRIVSLDDGWAAWFSAEPGTELAVMRAAERAALDGESGTSRTDGNAHWTRAPGRAQHGWDGERHGGDGALASDGQNLSRDEIRKKAETLRRVIESASVAILGTDAERHVVIWNGAAERMFGYPYHAIAGTPVPFAIELDRAEAICELRLECADGAKIDVLCSGSAMLSGTGALLGYVATFCDITERKRAQRQMEHLQRMESLGVLAGGVAHDFNNLLTGIMGNASLALLIAEDGSVVRPLLEEIVRGGERAAMLTRQLLAYAGKGRLVASSVDLNAIATEALATAQKLIVPERVRLALEPGEDLPKIEADPAQMQQAMVNVIVNGIEAFAAEEDGLVTVRTRRETVSAPHDHMWEAGDMATSGEYAVFEVMDTGFGINEETRSRIFEPFFSTKFTGRGLGLPAVLGIVRQHKGVLSLETEAGHGTTVSMFIPAAVQGAMRDADLFELELAGPNLILVVDDDQTTRETVRRALERWNFRVALAENGQSAVEIFPAIAPRVGVVILDLTMPVMGGEEALTHLRRVRPDVPVILISGFPAANAMERMRGGGVTLYLQKPFTPDQIVNCVREILDEGEAN